MKPRSCPVIVGPTAVGKTGLVTTLAARYPIEVISLDSRQIYHGLRIGTAQPSAEEQAVCPHHLVDFVSPDEKYDAVRFRRDFEKVYQEISERGRFPILAGGAGMYLTALRDGFFEVPGSTAEKLAEVRSVLDGLDDEVIRELLAAVDKESFQRIHDNDRYRSQRALEIFRLSGKTMTELKDLQQPDPVLGLQFPTFVLQRSVAELDKRIVLRTGQMLKEGWIEETDVALKKHPADCPGLMSIGYREIVAWRQGELPREGLEEAIVLVTRQYSKRQRTWFRGLVKRGQAAGVGDPGGEELVAGIERVLGGQD